MPNGSSRKSVVETPGVEVIVRSGDSELAVIAFFSDGAGGYDVLVGVGNPTDRGAIESVLKQAAQALGEAAFRPIPSNYNEGDAYAPPF